MDDIADIVQDFLVESREGLEQYDQDLIGLEQDPTSHELLSSLFRIVHTIKGTTGFLPFRRLEALAHSGESLLSQLRRGDVAMSRAVADALLELGDAIRTMLSVIDATGAEGDDDYVGLVARLDHLGLPVESRGTVVTPPVLSPVEEPEEGPVERTPADSTIRVDVTLLDSLMNLAGELVLTRNQVVQRVGSGADPALRKVSQQLALLTTELQEGIMQARLQPIDNVWRSLPRVVRDLSGQLGKSVRLEMHGREVDLDRTILEAVKDPLTHIVRNAIDHGIERPEERVVAGKPAEGVLRLHAFHEGGLVNVEITDDGAGIDPTRLRRAAVQRGVLTTEAAEQLHGAELLDVVFRPGFSTARDVTNVSGRGVGMDVVRTNIEQVGGTVHLDSVPGEGTKIRIRIPLTLAIIPALLISSGGLRFAVPQVNVQELVRLGAGAGRGGIEWAHDAPVYRLRNRLLPLLDLRDQLGQPPRAEAPRHLAVLQVNRRQFGILVDGVDGTEEIVVKPTGHQFRDIGIYAGATILGDGGLALILDVAELARRGEVLAGQDEDASSAITSAAARDVDAVDGGGADAGETQVLLVALPDGGRLAVPLSAVRRLEKLPAAAVDRLGDRLVVNYRGGLLPLVWAESALGSGVASAPTELPPELTIVVCRVEDVTVGLVVDRIGEITDGRRLAHPGADGAAQEHAPLVVSGHVTRRLDLQNLLLAVDVHLLAHTTSAEALR